MPKLSEEMKKTIQSKPFALATVNQDGTPNVVPMGFTTLISDDEFLIMDNFMLKTRQNIEATHKAALAFWDMESHLSYQFKGAARVEDSGPVFKKGLEIAKARNSKFTPKGVVIIKVEEIYNSSPGPNAGKKLA